jgi:hypothetical protein
MHIGIERVPHFMWCLPRIGGIEMMWRKGISSRFPACPGQANLPVYLPASRRQPRAAKAPIAIGAEEQGYGPRLSHGEFSRFCGAAGDRSGRPDYTYTAYIYPETLYATMPMISLMITCQS